MRGLIKNFLCRAGYEPCVKEARDQFKKWLTDEEPDKGNPLVVKMRERKLDKNLIHFREIHVPLSQSAFYII